METNNQTYKWWGWGYSEESYNLENRPGAWPYLEQKLGLSGEKYPAINFDEIELPALRLSSENLKILIDLCRQENVDSSKISRLSHSLGQSYGDLLKRRKGKISNPVDVVVYPESENQIQEILKLASANQLAIIPYGGGTTVTGSLEMKTSASHRGIISLDMKRMSRVNIDPISNTITAEAGILGPNLEAIANKNELTLGHFPQSFEFSSLGGWLATRSAGQNSTKYGKIEHMLVSVRAVTPTGIFETKTVPASAVGPDLNQLIVGSEGTLGIITRATLKLHPLPAYSEARGILFKDFDNGIKAIREIMQAGVIPSVLRLSDEAETEAFFMLRSRSKNNLKNVVEETGLWLLEKYGYSFLTSSLLLLIFEGRPDQVRVDRKTSLKICGKYGGVSLGSSPGKSWLKERFKHPYFRDILLDNAIMIDTLETATTWERLESLYSATKNSLHQAIERYGMKSLVLAHVSHTYTEGASLYFTFMSKQKEDEELEQWLVIKNAAIETILENGGTLSHHHGVGRDHADWLEKEIGHVGRGILIHLKERLDPQNILNPSNLTLPE